MPPKRNGRYKLPVPLPEGKVLDDTEGRQWVLGKMIGCGGFGLIYLAFPTNKPDEDAKHVVKVEYQENGPLFSELKFYQRAAKQECIKRWIAVKQLDYLGIPRFYGSGLTTFKEKSYRFMVMERLGIDLQKLSDRNGTFGKSAVLQLGIRMLDVLEYIHENEYIHGDIKAANLLLGYKNSDRVYLADYGLSYRYCPNGNHKQYQENPRKGHNGTMEFTSLDAHKGVALSRRSDLEILGYCLLRWLCGELPWERDLQDPRAVQIAKTNLLDELPDSVFKWAPSGSHCREIAQFLQCAHSLAYNEKPDYQMLKKILNPGGVPLGPLELSIHRPSADALRPGSQKVDSRKPAKQPAHQTQDKLRERKVGGRRSVASCVPLRPGQGDEELGALVSSETAQESARRRQKYQEPQDDLSDTNSSLQQSRGVPYSYSPDHHRCYGSSPGRNSTSLPPNWDTYDTLMTDTGVTELESSEALWPPISQFTLSEETKTAVCFYGFLILILLMLIFLVSYFL